MKRNRGFTLLAACIIVLSCLGAPASAVAKCEAAVSIKELNCEFLSGSAVAGWNSSVVERAFGKINISIPGNTTTAAKSQSFYLEAGESVKLNCVYSPASANVDFGLIAPDGAFYYIRAVDGNFKESIKVDERGHYTLTIRNNSADTVTVMGYVNY